MQMDKLIWGCADYITFLHNNLFISLQYNVGVQPNTMLAFQTMLYWEQNVWII